MLDDTEEQPLAGERGLESERVRRGLELRRLGKIMVEFNESAGPPVSEELDHATWVWPN